MASLYPEYDYNGFDPEELRRRQLLAPTEQPSVEELPGSSIAMAPDEGDEEAAPVSTGSKLSPAQQQYQKVLGQMPQYQKPSRGRRALAAIAGGLTGLRDPKLGIDTANQINRAPFNRQMTNWQMAMSQAQGGRDIEKEAQAQDIAQRRATAYSTSADARMRAANATEQFRQFQQAHVPWAPHTMEEAEQMEALKHPVQPKAWAPGSMEEYLQVHPLTPHVNPLELESVRHKNRMGEIGVRESGANARAAMRGQQTKTPASAPPQQQAQAEILAARQLIRANPEYSSFFHPGDPSKKVPAHIKTIDELPKAGGFLGLGLNGISPAQESLARDKYRQFLSDLEKKKKEVLGSKAGGAPQWDIQQDEEEDDQ